MSSLKRRKGELLDIARNYHAASSSTTEAIYDYLSSLDTPRSLTVWLLFSKNEHDQLVALECDATNYQDGYSFRLDYEATSFLSKSTFLRTSFKKDEVAIAKFLQYEELCKSTNDRFRNPALDPKYHGSNVWLLNATKRIISRILGDYSGDELVENANWGPGVSTLIKGEDVSAFNKFHKECGITRDLYDLVRTWFPTAYPLWHTHRARVTEASWYEFQVGNEVITVPKNSKTDRVIAVEPGLNLWFQKSIGTMIRRRLLRVGIDLNSQYKNQHLAYIGSKERRLATVDFSSASDSIALELVRELLPPRWFQLMDVCRSKLGSIKGTSFRWQKFSSMGNAFTFELESLIFFAASLAVLEFQGVPANMEELSVFGDDVIIPSDSFDLYSSYCDFLGFKVNKTKSFSSGCFRESCGSHFFDGVSCKPIFLKERLSHVESLYKLANAVRSLAHRHNNYRGCDSRFMDCWHNLLRRVPEPLRFRTPFTAGDVGFSSNFDESTPSRARYGIEGYFYRALSNTAITRSTEHPDLILARLWQLESIKRAENQHSRVRSAGNYASYAIREDSRRFRAGGDLSHENTYDLRGRTRRVLTNPLVAQWYDLGPWE